jgi:hypothetical protein
VYVVYLEISDGQMLGEVWSHFKANLNINKSLLFLFISIALVPVNLFLESTKWQILINRSTLKISSSKAFKAVLAGSTLGLMTPSRIGDYGGRVLLLPSKYNWWGMIATLVCSISQNLVNFVLGIGALIYFGEYFLQKLSSDWIILISMIGLITIAVFLLLVGKADILDKIKANTKNDEIHYWLENIAAIGQFKSKDVTQVFVLSIVRYGVYSIQMALLLLFFGVDMPAEPLFGGIALLFLVQSGLPLPPLLSMMARAEVALLIWHNFELNEFSIIAATTSIWILNLILPSLLGMLIIFRINLLKSIGYGRKT